MATAQELTSTISTLTERVTNHISAGKWVAGVFGAWLVGLSIAIYHINGTISDVARLQADSTSKVVGELLAHPPSTPKGDVSDELKAASVILAKAKIGKQKPDIAVVKNVANRLIGDQTEYPDLPQVWKTTGDFINYKYEAYLQDHVKADIQGAYSLSCESIANTRVGYVFNHCNVDLEAIAGDRFIFYKCVLRYRGGAISIKHMDFVDCVFDVNVNAVPPIQGTRMMRQLAEANDTSKVSVSS